MLAVSVSSGSIAALTADNSAGSTFDWTFTSGATGDAAFDFLREGEQLILTYTLKTTDNSGAAGGDEAASTTSTVTITITGSNDTPVITNGPDTAGLTETNAQLSATGTLTLTDIDLNDTVTASVSAVAIDASSTYTGAVPAALTNTSNAALKAMLAVPAAAQAANPSAGSDITWTFTSGASGDSAFEFLAKDETLVLVYTITATG